MLNQLNCLKAGGLVMGILGVIIAIINVFYAIAVYEEVPMVNESFALNAFLGNAPDHIIRLFYFAFSIFDLLLSGLLIAGILLVNIWNELLKTFGKLIWGPNWFRKLYRFKKMVLTLSSIKLIS